MSVSIKGNNAQLTPGSLTGYYRTQLLDGCFDGGKFNSLEIMLGAGSPASPSFRVGLETINDPNCVNTTDTTVNYANSTDFTSTEANSTIVQIPLSRFKANRCKLRAVTLDRFAVTNSELNYYISSIKLITLCSPTSLPIKPPVTATGTPPTATNVGSADSVCKTGVTKDFCNICGGSNDCVGVGSISPSAVNMSVTNSFKLTGWGLTSSWANATCLLDGTVQVATKINSDSDIRCEVLPSQINSLGGHTLSLLVNNATLRYSLPFGVYPPNPEVATCRASAMLGSESSVTVDGFGLVATGSERCIVQRTGTTVAERFVVVPSITYDKDYIEDGTTQRPVSFKCPLKQLVNGGDFSITLTLDGKTPIPGAVSLKVYDTAPAYISTAFDNSGAAIYVTFDKVIRVPGVLYSWFDCRTVFDFGLANNAKLADSNCYLQGNNILIMVGTTATISPNDVLQVQANSIYSGANPFDLLPFVPTNGLRVNAPPSPPKPVVIFTAPEIVGSCDIALVSVAESYNSAGRPLNYTWYATDTLTNSTTNSTTSMFLARLVAINGTTKNYVTYEAGDLTPNTNYTITVVATNLLGISSNPTTLYFQKSAQILPTVRILSAPLEQDATDDLSILILASRAACKKGDVTNFGFKWTIDGPANTVSASALEKPTLFIPAKSMSAGTYRFTVFVWTTDNVNGKAYDTATITFTIPDPLFTITDSDFITGVDAKTTLKTYWYDSYASKNELPSISWSCVWDDDDTTACSYAKIFVPGTGKTLDIPSGTLVAGKIYRFYATLTPTQGRTQIRKQIRVTAAAGKVPVAFASVQQPSFQAKRVIITDAVGISGGLVSGTYDLTDANTVITYQWSTAPKAGYATLTFAGITTTEPRLLIPAGTLAGGSSYSFLLTVTIGDKTATASVDITVAKDPTVGNLGISIWGNASNSVGVALQDTYDLTADQWTADPDDLPLMYSFDIFTSQTAKLPSITAPFQASAKFLSRLPEGTNNTVKVQVTARSQARAISSRQFNVTVLPFVADTSKLTSTFTNFAAEAKRSGDTAGLLRFSSSIGAKVMKNLKKSRTRLMRRDEEADLLQSVYEGIVRDVIDGSPVTQENMESQPCSVQEFFDYVDYLSEDIVTTTLQLFKGRILDYVAQAEQDPYLTVSDQARGCYLSVMNGVVQKFSKKTTTRKRSTGSDRQADVSGAVNNVNTLWMRGLACGADPSVTNIGTTKLVVQKVPAAGNTVGDFVAFPEDFKIGAIDCYCVQINSQDKGSFDFVTNTYYGLASQVVGLTLRDCSSPGDAEPVNSAKEETVSNLPTRLNVTIVPDIAAKANEKYTCGYVRPDTKAFATNGVTTYIDGNKVICSSNHLTSFAIVLQAGANPTSTSSSTSSSTPTSTTDASPTPIEDEGLSTGAIAGIAIGACAGVGLIGAGVYFLKKK